MAGRRASPGGRPRPPRDMVLPPLLTPFSGTALEPRGDYDAVHFANCSFAGQAADGAVFLGCLGMMA